MNSLQKGTQSPNKSPYRSQNKNKQYYRVEHLPPLLTLEDSQSIQIITLHRQNIIKNLEIYAWRSKTYLPILKPTHIVVFPEQQSNLQNVQFQFDTSNINNHVCHQNFNKSFSALKEFVQRSPHIQNYKVRVQIEEVKFKLKQVNDLPLPQFLYLLKETLIGFELLIDIFGYFEITDEMIIVNASSQWRLWINQNYKLNQKKQCFQSQKQFINKLLTLLQKHCIVTSASKQFFAILKQIIQEKQPSFLKILSKINQYISNHKVFQVNRVFLPLSRNSKPFLSQKSSIQIPALRKLSNDSGNSPAKRRAQINFYPQSPKQPIINLQRVRFPLNHNNKNYHQDEKIQKTYQTNIKPTSFQHIPTNINNSNFQTYTSQKTFNYEVFSPKSQKNIHSFNTSPIIKLEENLQFTPKNKHFSNVFNLNHSNKLSQGNSGNVPNAQINRYRQAKSPSPVKIQQPPLRCNSGNPQIKLTQKIEFTTPRTKPQRKYSDNLQKIKSTDALLNVQKKIAGSSIYEAENMGKLKKQLSMNEHQPYEIKIHNNNKKISNVSPNNSSSTKQVKNSCEMSKELIAGYLKMKQKDLGPNKVKNSLSFVNNQERDVIDKKIYKADKNMTISHQFETYNKDNLTSQQQILKKGDYRKEANKNQWVNNISGLFSDNVSIRHLKQSVKFKGQQEQPFEKEHLKDIKLQMLQKFGRKVNHIVIQQDHQDKYALQNHYRSMQLIQQQTQQVKSYLQSERRQDQDIKPRSMRSKHQTTQVKGQTSNKIRQQLYSQQLNSQYDDNDADSEIPSQSSTNQKQEKPGILQSDNGFSFQTQMYVINPKRKY